MEKEEHAVEEILEAQMEIADGQGLKGDPRELIKQF